LHAELQRLQVDHEVDRGEVEHGGNDRRDDDLGVGNARDLGHDEGAGAHDGRHDLTARGRGRLDGAGGARWIADPLHERDGERAGGDDVAGRGAVDHAHEAGGEDGDLGRAAARVAGGGEGEIDEIVADL